MPPRRNVKKKAKRKDYQRKKVCRFCADKLEISYKDGPRLRHYTTERGKIIPRRISGNCACHQRQLAVMLKRARALALLPFAGD